MLYMYVCIYRKTTGKKLSNILAKISLDGETVDIFIYPLWVFPYFPNVLNKIISINYIIIKIIV